MQAGIVKKPQEKQVYSFDYDKAHYETILAFIRSRLNVIGTSIYLLETDLNQSAQEIPNKKYLKIIKDELDSIRRLINE
ncbi:MAG: hypothetical protein Kow0037_10700 [Calditrichia bacterium]